jgi:hypothetical protein
VSGKPDLIARYLLPDLFLILFHLENQFSIKPAVTTTTVPVIPLPLQIGVESEQDGLVEIFHCIHG